jgi:integrase
MITVQEAFDTYRQRLELSETERTDTIRRHNEVRDCIKAKFDIKRDFLTGSYARHTKTKPLKDVDIFFVLSDSERKKWRDRPPSEILGAFKNCLADKYGKDAVDPGRRCATVEFDKNTKDEEGTRCVGKDLEGAERKLAEHITSRYEVSREGKRHPSQILVLDVLNLYSADVVSKHARPKETKGIIRRLAAFWGNYTLADVNGPRCREYVASRVGQPWKHSKPERTGRPPRLVTTTSPRRHLQILRAAINHHREEVCSKIVSVVLPEASPGREDFLTRSEAARILWAAYRAKNSVFGYEGNRHIGKHIARFTLVGLYTGTRHAAICGAAFQPAIGRGYVDLEHGVFYRHAQGKKKTKKRQPPVKLAPRILAHLRRWHRLGIAKHAVVEWNGKPVKSVRKGFAAAVKKAGIEKDVIPHLLRHTSATWMMQNGVDPEDAAAFLGMTVDMLERYAHHHPDYQKNAARAVSQAAGQKRDRNPVNKPR